MKFGLTDDERMARDNEPRLWFAWRPVDLLDGRIAWLEYVMTRKRRAYSWNIGVREYWHITPAHKPDRRAGDP